MAASFLRGTCPDGSCCTLLYFPGHEASVECCGCGQRHARAALLQVQPVEDVRAAAALAFRRALSSSRGTRGPENVKVLGSSNYHCKLVSPLLSTYGLEKSSGRARPLQQLTGQTTFQCSVLASYAFRLDEAHLETAGYGRDQSGSAAYLRDTLQMIQQSNDGEERLVPIHADGDGHCLVHALSRALTGRELFWHPLRINMQRHISDHLAQYQALFGEFIAADEWGAIVAECDPDFVPADGQPHGLRNLHVFALANVLRRPLLLLDSLAGMRSSGDYAALFLPAMVPATECRSGADATPNAPLCLAWSSAAHNHYIALVPVRERKLPRLPLSLLPKVWGVDQALRDQYLTLEDGSCVIGSLKSLQDGYVQRLTAAMDQLFLSKQGIHPELVADAHLHLFKRVGVFGYSPPYVCDEVRAALTAGRLYRCLRCGAVLEQRLEPAWLRPGGYLHQLATQQHGRLSANKHYRFPIQGILCSYDPGKDCLEMKEDLGIKQCPWCQSAVRRVDTSGAPLYENGDVTTTAAQSCARCSCGLKHFWDGREYDSPPIVFPVTLRWGNKMVSEKVTWFEGESDDSLNSNVYDTANQLVTKHFPGVFGVEVLVKQVVDQILEQTKPRVSSCAAEGVSGAAQSLPPATSPAETATKIIVTGMHTLHKEELGKSEAERQLKARIEKNAPMEQSRASQAASVAAAGAACGSSTAAAAAPACTAEPASPTSTAPATQSPPSPPPTPTSSATSTPIASPTAAATGPQREQTPTPAMSGCRVRVVASDGRLADLRLDADATYGQFIGDVCDKLSLARERIVRVLHGFPPRQVDLPDDARTPFKSGERVQLELRRETAAGASPPPAPAAVVAAPAPADPELAAGVQALVLASQLAGTDLWSQVQTMPRLFERGGLFFRLAEAEKPMTDGQRVRLQPLSGKVFVYSAGADALRLSLEPFGVHPVGAGVEARVLTAAAASASAPASAPPAAAAAVAPQQLHRLVSSGSGRVTAGVHLVPPRASVASFSGVGHTLGGATAGSAAAERDSSATSTPGGDATLLTTAGVSHTVSAFTTSATNTDGGGGPPAPYSNVTGVAGGSGAQFVRTGPGCVVLRRPDAEPTVRSATGSPQPVAEATDACNPQPMDET